MKFEKGKFYVYPGSKKNLVEFHESIAEMDSEMQDQIQSVKKHDSASYRYQDIGIARFPPLNPTTIDDTNPSIETSIQVVRFRRREYTLVLWECMAGDA